MQSREKMIGLSLYSLFAGIFPWIWLGYSNDWTTMLCGIPDRSNDAQYQAYWNCYNHLASFLFPLAYLLSFGTILLGVVSLRRHKSLPKKYIIFSLLGGVLGLGFLLYVPALIVLLLLIGGID